MFFFEYFFKDVPFLKTFLFYFRTRDCGVKIYKTNLLQIFYIVTLFTGNFDE